MLGLEHVILMNNAKGCCGVSKNRIVLVMLKQIVGGVLLCVDRVWVWVCWYYVFLFIVSNRILQCRIGELVERLELGLGVGEDVGKEDGVLGSKELLARIGPWARGERLGSRVLRVYDLILMYILTCHI